MWTELDWQLGCKHYANQCHISSKVRITDVAACEDGKSLSCVPKHLLYNSVGSFNSTIEPLFFWS